MIVFVGGPGARAPALVVTWCVRVANKSETSAFNFQFSCCDYIKEENLVLVYVLVFC